MNISQQPEQVSLLCSSHSIVSDFILTKDLRDKRAKRLFEGKVKK